MNIKLAKLVTDKINNIKEDVEGLEMKVANDIDVFDLFLNNDEKSIHLIIEPHISFKVCTEKMELVQDDIICNNSSEGVLNLCLKIFYNEEYLSSFKESSAENHEKPSKENLMVCEDLDI
ncbi:17836_t:CDS:1 [Funneliformis geosporum]|nr:17836_t:CDS:1 [Funneliformis geosporum]